MTDVSGGGGRVPGFWRSQGGRFLVLAAITLLMTIPLMMIGVISSERERYAEQVRREVGATWGGAQTLAGPFVVVPVERTQAVRRSDGSSVDRTDRDHLVLTPQRLEIDVASEAQARRRGIYDATVFTATATLTGAFSFEGATALAEGYDEVLWDEARLVTWLSDPRALTDEVSATYGAAAHRFDPGAGLRGVEVAGTMVPIHVALGDPRGGSTFEVVLPLRGSGALRAIAAGRSTEMTMTSDWPHPSFDGNLLPRERTVAEEGFEASWFVPYLARGVTDGWVEEHGLARTERFVGGLGFGVSFFQPVDNYQKVERALKYAVLIIGLTLLTVFLIELATARAAHPVQYVLVGLAQCTFFLLVLALSEHVTFALAYLAASVATVGLLVAYVGSALGAGRMTWVAAAALVTLYGLLYLLLQSRDYALLIGALAAFATLGGMMMATRRVDWWSAGARPATGGAQ